MVCMYEKLLDQLWTVFCIFLQWDKALNCTILILQSFRLAFALVMGALMFMMMSLRQGKISVTVEADTVEYI
jgi:hypothetical protein